MRIKKLDKNTERKYIVHSSYFSLLSYHMEVGWSL